MTSETTSTTTSTTTDATPPTSTDLLPVMPTVAPAVFRDPVGATALLTDTLAALADVVDVDDDVLDLPTPCAAYDVAALRGHVLGWLTFFAAALGDPAGDGARPDAEAFTLRAGVEARTVVEQASTDIAAAIAAGAASELVTMSSARMAGDGVLAMACGEYLVHAWDLATATGRDYVPPAAAVGPAHEFLLGMVQPEYRGPDSGFFDDEVDVSEDAAPFDRLLGFGGRDPHWRPGA